MAFEFLGLLEFALVNSFVRKATEFEELGTAAQNKIKGFSRATTSFHGQSLFGKPTNNFDQDVDDMESSSPDMVFHVMTKKLAWQRATMVDVSSRVLFPSCFTVFNVLYWFYYA